MQAEEQLNIDTRLYAGQFMRCGCLSIVISTFIIFESVQPYVAAMHGSTIEQDLHSVKNSRVEATRLLDAGQKEYVEGHYQNAIAIYHQALLILQAIGNQTEISQTLYDIGLAHYSAREYPTALDFYHQSLEIYQALHDPINIAQTLHAIGLVYYNLSEYSEALVYYHQSLAIPEYSKDQTRLGKLLFATGLTFYRLGKYSNALEYYQQALIIAQDTDSRSNETAILHSIGIIYTALGQYSQAAEYYQQALALLREIGDDIAAQGRLFDSIGLNYFQQNQYQQAVDAYQNALVLHKQAGNFLGEGRTLNNLGQTYLLLEKYPEALSNLEKALEIVRQLDDRNYESGVLDSLGELYSNLRQYSVAFEFYQHSLTIAKEIGDRAGEIITLSKLGELFAKQEEFEAAIVFYKQSVNVTESIREDLRTLPLEQQQSYTETIVDTYRALAQLLLEQGRILEAQQVLELLKVEELREFIRGRVLNTATREIELTELEDNIWQEFGGLIALGQQIDTCEQAGTSCDQLYEQRSELTQEFNDAATSFTDEIRNRFDQDSAALNPADFIGEANDIVETPRTILIYPVVLEDKLWVLWATAGGVVNSIEVPVTRQQLGEAVLCFRQLMASPDAHSCDRGDADIQAVAQELYRYLIPPQLEQEFAQHEIENLVFSLDRITRYIPMAALYDGEHYLIQRYTVSTVLSAGLTRYDNPLPQSITSTSVLALGLSEAVPENASEETPEFIALSHVPDELDAIGQIYPGEELLNQQFSDRAFHQLNNYQVLHIATHGVFVPARQDRSYLILGTKQPLRIRQIEDIQQFFSNLSLVVLSACETALGSTDQDGIEINGIAHSFIQSGANTVIASLWQVNDGSTSLLMQHFYNNLAQGTPAQPVTISQALRQAQLSLLQGETGSAGGERGIVGIRVNPNATSQQADNGQSDYSHPYYWAPFILIGNGL